MADGTARIEIRPVGEDRVRRALNGTTREARRAQRAQQRDRRQTERDVDRGERGKTRATRRGSRQRTRAERDAQRELRREDQQTTREFERNQRARTRSARRGSQQRRRAASQGFGQGLGMAKGALGAFGLTASAGGVAQAVSRQNIMAQQSLDRSAGVQGVFDSLPENVNLQEQIVKVVGQTTSDPEKVRQDTQEIIKEMNAAAVETGVDQKDLFAGLKSFQLVFSNLKFGREVMKDIARTAEATGTPFEDLVRLLGEAQQQFGITGDEAKEFLDLTVQQGKEGAIQPGEFANAFAREFGTFTAARGTEGLDAAREFGAVSQVLRKGGGNPEEVATRMRSLLNQLSRKSVQEKFAKRGVQVTNEEGRVRSLADIFGELADTDVKTKTDLQELVPEIRGSAGAGALLKQIRMFRNKEGEDRSENIIRDLANVSAEEGAKGTDAVFQVLRSMPSFRQRQEALGLEGLRLENAQDVADAGGDQFRQRLAIRKSIPSLEGALDMPLVGDLLRETVAGTDTAGFGGISPERFFMSDEGKAADAGLRLQGAQKIAELLGLPGQEAAGSAKDAAKDLQPKIDDDSVDKLGDAIERGTERGMRNALDNGQDPRGEEGGWWGRLF